MKPCENRRYKYYNVIYMHFVDLDYTPNLNAIISVDNAIFYGFTFLLSSCKLSIDLIKGRYFLFRWPSSFSPNWIRRLIYFDISVIVRLCPDYNYNSVLLLNCHGPLPRRTPTSQHIYWLIITQVVNQTISSSWGGYGTACHSAYQIRRIYIRILWCHHPRKVQFYRTIFDVR